MPWLILSATILFLLQPLVGRLVKTTHRPLPLWLLIAMQFAIAVYGGYFGAGIGILMLAALGLMGVSNIHEANAIKAVQALADQRRRRRRVHPHPPGGAGHSLWR